MRPPYFVNTLIDVLLQAQTVPTPGELRQGVVLFPLPRVESAGRLSSHNVVLDTGTWFVHDQRASTLPAQCPSQRAAQLLADTWMDNVATSTVNPDNPEQVTNWCRWFVDAHPDCAILTPMKPPAVDALAMTNPVWPSGVDPDAAAASLADKVPSALDEIAALLGTGQENESEASPGGGQAHEENTEAAS
jgi:hypothetical protein